MKFVKWILCILIFAICITCSICLGNALVDGIVAGVVISAVVYFLLKTIEILTKEKTINK